LHPPPAACAGADLGRSKGSEPPRPAHSRQSIFNPNFLDRYYSKSYKFHDHFSGTRAFPLDLDEWFVGRTGIANFTKECMDLDIKYMGLCCGSSAHSLRTMAETVGKTPAASRYSPKMELHTHFGDTKRGVVTYDMTIAAQVGLTTN
jgi:hypothetical protein